MKLKSPKGTRDFFPEDMAWRNHLVDAWRRVSVRNGFEQIDGPIFEHLELYRIKSGEGIVSELFNFEDRGGRELAVRPEFTPTLARMVAEKANALPRPIKWFATPNCCRAESPQRGRLREFWQWNIDMIGVDSPAADAEVIFTLVDLLRELGLKPEHVKVKISHRDTVRHILTKLGVAEQKMLDAFDLLDRRDKLEKEAFTKAAGDLGLDGARVERFEQTCRMKYSIGEGLSSMKATLGEANLADLEGLDDQLRAFRIAEWCEYDLGIVRGLAYYTGTVFELHEVSGAERAMAGGGRYDKLIELFGGPSMPAVGFGMGDVVLGNVLRDKGLAYDDVAPRPDAFVIALNEDAAAGLPGIVSTLRTAGLHARFSYKTTRNMGKLMKDASNAKAKFAVILGEELKDGNVVVKNLETSEQKQCSVGELLDTVRG